MEIVLIGTQHPISNTSHYKSTHRPFVEARAECHNMSMLDEIGYSPDTQNEYKCRACIHMDAFRYVSWYVCTMNICVTFSLDG